MPDEVRPNPNVPDDTHRPPILDGNYVVSSTSGMSDFHVNFTPTLNDVSIHNRISVVETALGKIWLEIDRIGEELRSLRGLVDKLGSEPTAQPTAPSSTAQAEDVDKMVSGMLQYAERERDLSNLFLASDNLASIPIVKVHDALEDLVDPEVMYSLLKNVNISQLKFIIRTAYAMKREMGQNSPSDRLRKELDYIKAQTLE